MATIGRPLTGTVASQETEMPPEITGERGREIEKEIGTETEIETSISMVCMNFSHQVLTNTIQISEPSGYPC